MATPEGVCVAFTDPTLAVSPSWTRLDDPDGVNIIPGWKIDRGRNTEFNKTQAGNATATLLDKDGIIDPTNEGGPYFGNIDPVKQACIAIKNPVTDSWATLIRGFSDWSFSIDRDTSFKVINGTLTIDDAMDLMAFMEMVPDNAGEGRLGNDVPLLSLGQIYYPEDQQVDDRIKQALADAGWPLAMANIFSGNVALQGTVYARRDQLITVIQDAADAEFPDVSMFYISKDGIARFRGRYSRFDPSNPQYGIREWFVGDGPHAALSASIAPISGLNFRRSKLDIINCAIALPKGVTDVEAIANIVKDAESISKYGWRSVSFQDLITLHGDEVGGNKTAVQETQLYARYHVDNFKFPRTRCTQIRFRPKNVDHYNAAALWDLMCNIEIGDVVFLETTHPGGGGFNEGFFVEGIHYSASPARKDIHDLTLDIDVSPQAFYDTNPFV